MLQNLKIYEINMSTMESFKSEPQFSPFSPRKPSLFLFFARSCSITLYRTQPIKIELLSYYLTIMVRYRNLVRQIGPSESIAQGGHPASVWNQYIISPEGPTDISPEPQLYSATLISAHQHCHLGFRFIDRILLS